MKIAKWIVAGSLLALPLAAMPAGGASATAAGQADLVITSAFGALHIEAPGYACRLPGIAFGVDGQGAPWVQEMTQADKERVDALSQVLSRLNAVTRVELDALAVRCLEWLDRDPDAPGSEAVRTFLEHCGLAPEPLEAGAGGLEALTPEKPAPNPAAAASDPLSGPSPASAMPSLTPPKGTEQVAPDGDFQALAPFWESPVRPVAPPSPTPPAASRSASPQGPALTLSPFRADSSQVPPLPRLTPPKGLEQPSPGGNVLAPSPGPARSEGPESRAFLVDPDRVARALEEGTSRAEADGQDSIRTAHASLTFSKEGPAFECTLGRIVFGGNEAGNHYARAAEGGDPVELKSLRNELDLAPEDRLALGELAEACRSRFANRIARAPEGVGIILDLARAEAPLASHSEPSRKRKAPEPEFDGDGARRLRKDHYELATHPGLEFLRVDSGNARLYYQFRTRRFVCVLPGVVLRAEEDGALSQEGLQSARVPVRQREDLLATLEDQDYEALRDLAAACENLFKVRNYKRMPVQWQEIVNLATGSRLGPKRRSKFPAKAEGPRQASAVAQRDPEPKAPAATARASGEGEAAPRASKRQRTDASFLKTLDLFDLALEQGLPLGDLPVRTLLPTTPRKAEYARSGGDAWPPLKLERIDLTVDGSRVTLGPAPKAGPAFNIPERTAHLGVSRPANLEPFRFGALATLGGSVFIAERDRSQGLGYLHLLSLDPASREPWTLAKTLKLETPIEILQPWGRENLVAVLGSTDLRLLRAPGEGGRMQSAASATLQDRGRVRGLATTPGALVVTAFQEKRLLLHDLGSDLREVASVELQDVPTSVQAPKGTLLSATLENQGFATFDTRSGGTCAPVLAHPAGRWPTAHGWIGDQTYLTGNGEGRIHLWDLRFSRFPLAAWQDPQVKVIRDLRGDGSSRRALVSGGAGHSDYDCRDLARIRIRSRATLDAAAPDQGTTLLAAPFGEDVVSATDFGTLTFHATPRASGEEGESKEGSRR